MKRTHQRHLLLGEVECKEGVLDVGRGRLVVVSTPVVREAAGEVFPLDLVGENVFLHRAISGTESAGRCWKYPVPC